MLVPVPCIIITGDQLTAARARGHRKLKQMQCLNGLAQMTTDWHAKVVVLGVSLSLFGTSSYCIYSLEYLLCDYLFYALCVFYKLTDHLEALLLSTVGRRPYGTLYQLRI